MEFETETEEVSVYEVSASEIIRNSTGNEDGFPLLNDEAKRDVIYNIVTCHTGSRKANKWYYSSFGIAYYDFEVVPFANKDLAYITAAEGYDSIADAAADNVPGVTYNDRVVSEVVEVDTSEETDSSLP